MYVIVDVAISTFTISWDTWSITTASGTSIGNNHPDAPDHNVYLGGINAIYDYRQVASAAVPVPSFPYPVHVAETGEDVPTVPFGIHYLNGNIVPNDRNGDGKYWNDGSIYRTGIANYSNNGFGSTNVTEHWTYYYLKPTFTYHLSETLPSGTTTVLDPDGFTKYYVFPGYTVSVTPGIYDTETVNGQPGGGSIFGQGQATYLSSYSYAVAINPPPEMPGTTPPETPGTTPPPETPGVTPEIPGIIVYGQPGNDTIRGFIGADTLLGGPGNDYIIGGPGADILNGGPGNDRIYGGDGNDLINGGPGNDKLYGEAGDDALFGDKGDDLINGGIGNDVLYGGGGKDRFVFNTAISSVTNVDRIADFNVKQDTILLDNAVMSALGRALEAREFWKSTSGLAHDRNDRVIYETDTGWLNYDGDGSAAGGAVHIATLTPNLALTYSNFIVI